MNVNLKTALELSRLSSRGVFGKALSEITTIDDNLMVLVADVMSSAR